MTLTRKSTFTKFTYNICNTILEQVSFVRDLGVVLDKSLSFDLHIDKICNSGHNKLGFIKWRAQEFDDMFLTKQLYSALVRSRMEYASIVWSSYTNSRIDPIESVHKQFLLFALRNLGFSGYRLPKYEKRLLLIDMVTLKQRRELASALFGFDLVRNNINCPEFCERIVFTSHDYNTRHKRPIVEEFYRNDFSLHNPLNECIRNFNKYKDQYSMNVTKETFKLNILRKMKTLFNQGQGLSVN